MGDRKPADKDILETLASLEFLAEVGAGKADAQAVTTFRRLAREAGYEIPESFDWQEHLPEEQEVD